jgi:hypothetical protein
MDDGRFAIVELMGHRRFGAKVSTVEEFGVKLMRAEVLEPVDGAVVVQLIHPQAVYAVTLCTEAQARGLNTRWALQSALPMLPGGEIDGAPPLEGRAQPARHDEEECDDDDDGVDLDRAYGSAR